MFSTRFTTARDFRTDWYKRWSGVFSLGDAFNRKSWEVAAVSETLRAHGSLTTGKRGIGFGVGCEKQPVEFARFGPTIVATDLLPKEWSHVHQDFHASHQHSKVSTRIVDMNSIDDDLVDGHDFAWSVCSMDHCGSVWMAKRFLLNQLNILRSGGIAVNTAEYAICLGLPRSGPTCWMNWEDLLDVRQLVSSIGHELAPIDWTIGDSIEDHQVSPHPWNTPVTLKLEANAGRWAIAVCFAVRKLQPGVFWIPVDESEARTAINDFQRSHSHT